ncbi:hypothetical protein Tco_0289724 [Tanacetum coccineum]
MATQQFHDSTIIQESNLHFLKRNHGCYLKKKEDVELKEKSDHHRHLSQRRKPPDETKKIRNCQHRRRTPQSPPIPQQIKKGGRKRTIRISNHGTKSRFGDFCKSQMRAKRKPAHKSLWRSKGSSDRATALNRAVSGLFNSRKRRRYGVSVRENGRKGSVKAGGFGFGSLAVERKRYKRVALFSWSVERPLGTSFDREKVQAVKIRRDWRRTRCDIMALEFNRVALDVAKVMLVACTNQVGQASGTFSCELLWAELEPLRAPGLASVVRTRDESGSLVVNLQDPIVRKKVDLDTCEQRKRK